MCDCAFPRLTEKCSDFFIRAGKTLQMYNSILKGLKLKKDILATYRKRAIDARFLSLADNNKNINVGQEEWILQVSQQLFSFSIYILFIGTKVAIILI